MTGKGDHGAELPAHVCAAHRLHGSPSPSAGAQTHGLATQVSEEAEALQLQAGPSSHLGSRAQQPAAVRTSPLAPLAQELATDRPAAPLQGSPGAPRQLGHGGNTQSHILGFRTSESQPSGEREDPKATGAGPGAGDFAPARSRRSPAKRFPAASGTALSLSTGNRWTGCRCGGPGHTWL